MGRDIHEVIPLWMDPVMDACIALVTVHKTIRTSPGALVVWLPVPLYHSAEVVQHSTVPLSSDTSVLHYNSRHGSLLPHICPHFAEMPCC